MNTVAKSQRIVVKIGSKPLSQPEPEASARFLALGKQVAELKQAGHEVVLVSSGAVAKGFTRLGLPGRPETMPLLQASAAVGQSLLMRTYDEVFAAHGIPVAQVLLTHADLADRERYLNARASLDALVKLGALPIINENDTVSVEELKFGDNDQLAAMVATLVEADLLILLTDVEGLWDAEGKVIPEISTDETVDGLIRAKTSHLSLGGMGSKVDAAKRAARGGVLAVIASAWNDQAMVQITRGEPVGTRVLPSRKPLSSRRHWIAFTLKPKGFIVVDEGAVKALTTGNASLLPIGILGIRGDFDAGDAVSVVTPSQVEIARGLCRFNTREVARMVGTKSEDASIEIIHRDELVVL